MATYSPASAASFEFTLPADASAITVTIATAAGDVLLGPTSIGIAHLAVGQYVYTWSIPADQADGGYVLTWNATVAGQPEQSEDPFTVSASELPGTWCTIADVALLAGATVTQQDVNLAQVMIEALDRRVWRVTDADKRDFYWLKRAAAWQARYVAAHPEVLDLMDVAAINQDGIGITFKPGDSQLRVLFSPVALRLLNNVFRGSNSTIRLNSAFQKNRPPRGSIGAGATVPWRSI